MYESCDENSPLLKTEFGDTLQKITLTMGHITIDLKLQKLLRLLGAFNQFSRVAFPPSLNSDSLVSQAPVISSEQQLAEVGLHCDLGQL